MVLFVLFFGVNFDEEISIISGDTLTLRKATTFGKDLLGRRKDFFVFCVQFRINGDFLLVFVLPSMSNDVMICVVVVVAAVDVVFERKLSSCVSHVSPPLYAVKLLSIV